MRGCPLAIQRAIQHALEGVNAHEHQGACAGKGGVGDQLARPPDPQVRRLRFAVRMALQPMVPARLVRRSTAARRLRDAVVVDRPRLRRGLVHRHRLCPRQEAPPLQYPLDALDRYRRSGHIDACAHLVRILVPHRPYRIRACRGGRHHERHPMGHVGRAVLAHQDVVLRFLYRHHRRPGSRWCAR